MKDPIWYQKADQRLSAWREFRDAINQKDLASALQSVTDLWSYAPYVTYYLDPAKPGEWPDPWLLLSENYYCDLAKTLGMFYTIALSEHGKNNLALEIFYDVKRKEQINIVVVNEIYVLNYHFGRIVNKSTVSDDCVKKFSYVPQDLDVQKYM